MEPVSKNVGRAEAISRSIIGIILIIFSFFYQGILCWVGGILGLVFILTAVFGY
jgi:hypothetical protein